MKDPFVEDDLREEYSQNIENMPENLKEHYDYIWLARFGSSEICQFDSEGNENLWTQVRESEKGLNKVYWIPIDSSKKTYGIDGKGKPFRRVAIEFSKKGKEKVFYYILADNPEQSKADKFLVISPEGEVIETEDYQVNPHNKFG